MRESDTAFSFLGVLVVGVVGWVAFLGASIRADSAGWRYDCPDSADTMLRLARSDDGLSFKDSGEVFAVGAAAPDLFRLPDGGLIALFDRSVGEEGATAIVMAVSADHGRTWSPLHAVTLLDKHDRTIPARHGDLERMPDGSLRLFFAMPLRLGGESEKLTVIRSAVTGDGLTYRLDHSGSVRLRASGDLHPTVGRVGGAVHLYADDTTGLNTGGRFDGTAARHVVSLDGHQFARQAPVRVPRATFVGSVVRERETVRAYVTSDRGVTSLTTKDGRDWRPEPGVRMSDGWDPAVVRLEDGSYLMLYCTVAPKEEIMMTPLVPDEWVRPGEPVPGLANADRAGYAVSTDAGDSGSVSSHAAGAGYGAGETMPGTDDDRSEDRIVGGKEDAKVWDDSHRELVEDHALGFAPPPNFTERVDYIRWYQEYMLTYPMDNAYYVYAKFMPGPGSDGGNEYVWPELTNMFTNRDSRLAPGPWRPEDHPSWEASNLAAEDLLERFREATTHTGYCTPVVLGADGPPPEDELLANIMLPQLSRHRAAARATLADAWRVRGDSVSSTRMLDALETCLRGADHLDQGATLIEDLVAMAERSEVQRSARWALARGVFSGDELEPVMDTLRTLDQDRDENPLRYIRGDHAVAMDLVQSLFSHPDPNDERGRLGGARELFDEESARRLEENLAGLGPEDAGPTIDAIEAFSRTAAELMSVGYPEVRAADVREATSEHCWATPIVAELIPSLSSYYQRGAREEASRRATQVAYAAHIHRAETGRWPESLDELSGEYGVRMCEDPFSGRQFGYRVTADGPLLYSAGENGLDDGGVHNPRWGDAAEDLGSSDDYVFWPPQPQ